MFIFHHSKHIYLQECSKIIQDNKFPAKIREVHTLLKVHISKNFICEVWNGSLNNVEKILIQKEVGKLN